MKPDEKADLVEHLDELRTRIIRSLVYLAVGAVAGWLLYPATYRWLLAPVMRPLEQMHGLMMINSVMEAFMTQVQVSLYTALALASPLVLWELWAFVAPGLTPSERRAARPILPTSVLLFIVGVALFYVTAPRMFAFMLGFTPPGVRVQLLLQKQIVQITRMFLAFGLCFQLPLVLAFLIQVNILSTDTMRRHRREAIVAIAVLAAVITPSQDAITMTVLAAPLILLYEGTIWWGRLATRKPQ